MPQDVGDTRDNEKFESVSMERLTEMLWKVVTGQNPSKGSQRYAEFEHATKALVTACAAKVIKYSDSAPPKTPR